MATPKRGGKNKRRIPKANPLVDPLKVQTNSYVLGAIKPYQGLLTNSVAQEQTQADNLAGLGRGTQAGFTGISNDLTANYAKTVAANQAAGVGATADNNAQSSFLQGVLGGNYGNEAIGIGAAQNLANGTQESSLGSLNQFSGLNDIGRQAGAANTMLGESQRDNASQWASRRFGLNSQIASIQASRPFIRSKLEQQALDNQLARQAAGEQTRQFNASQTQDQNQFNASLNAATTAAGIKADAAAMAAAAKLDGKAQSALDKQAGEWAKTARATYTRLFKAGSPGVDGTQTKLTSPPRPLRTSFNDLVNQGVPPSIAAQYAALWTKGSKATYGASKTGRAQKAANIAKIYRDGKVGEDIIKQLINEEYGKGAYGQALAYRDPNKIQNGLSSVVSAANGLTNGMNR